MIDKKLLRLSPESPKFIAGNVFSMWISLLSSVFMSYSIAIFFAKLMLAENRRENSVSDFLFFVLPAISISLLVRFFCTKISYALSFHSSKNIKKRLRGLIFEKLLKIGHRYNEKINTAELVQLSVEGVDQLETYFASYLPQFFYAMIASLSLFALFFFINARCALVLFVCVPLIPITIAFVQTIAKKLLSKYWTQYTKLGSSFLENIQGLTTLKIYEADEIKNREMNTESENFRKITMRVLTMQLNSISIMDLVAYGGSALGMIVATLEFSAGRISLWGAIFVILVSSEFFIPMRRLGSLFHIAMNGLAASKKIFSFLCIDENFKNIEHEKITKTSERISIDHLDFSYDENRKILRDVSFSFNRGEVTGIVGESGSGKSTVASLLFGEGVTYIGAENFLFKGTIAENLQVAKPDVKDDELWKILKDVKLADFLKSENGLETKLLERASNFSGGQRQRLSVARAILKDSPVLIFDEATSNVDSESENEIVSLIYKLSKEKIVIFISHRIKNLENAKKIYVMDKGIVENVGNKEELLIKSGIFKKLYNAQKELEDFSK